MKIHFEGTYKEMLRASSLLAGNPDLKVMDSCWIRPKNDFTHYWCLDVDVMYKIPCTCEDSIYERVYDEIYRKEPGLIDTPMSMSELYSNAWDELLMLAKTENPKLEEIVNKIDEIEKRAKRNFNEIEYFERNYDIDKKMID